MDKHRIEGAAKHAKGAVKEALRKVTGDATIEGQGKADKVQKTAGGAKDAVRDVADK